MVKPIAIVSLLGGLALLAVNLYALDVSVHGLFDGSAVVSINGQQRLLRTGQSSPEGVKLISASSRRAQLEIDGQRQDFALSKRVGGSYSKPQRATVSIPLSEWGQYLVAGQINGQPVHFLVDTGANLVAMSSRMARQLNIPYETTGTRSIAQTAGARVNSYIILLDRIEVGAIRVHNVQAVVLESDFPDTILLGMSYLEHVELKEERGVLSLTSRY